MNGEINKSEGRDNAQHWTWPTKVVNTFSTGWLFLAMVLWRVSDVCAMREEYSIHGFILLAVVDSTSCN